MSYFANKTPAVAGFMVNMRGTIYIYNANLINLPGEGGRNIFY